MHKSIAFVTGGLEFNGNSINEKALGGSESAMIYMAKYLAAHDNDVTVYCNCDKPGNYDNVSYRHVDQYMNDELAQFDVLIVSRFTEFLARPLDTKLNLLWCHDIGVDNLSYALGSTDMLMCLSDYHKQLYIDTFNIKRPEYIWTTSNGYDTLPVTRLSYNDKKDNYIYASRPERGLKFLLKNIWPKIIENNPNAKLNICGYDYNLGVSKETQAEYDAIESLIKDSKNVLPSKKLTKPEYYELLSQCAYMLYPTDFPEISCINALEAQYSGCLVITSDSYALSESVKTDTKVSATYGSPEYIDEFVNVVKKYTDDVYDNEVSKGLDLVSNYSWANVAASWDDRINTMFTERHDANKDKILDKLVYNSDIVAAYKLSGKQEYRDMLDKAQVDNLTKSDFIGVPKDEDYYLNDRSKKLIDLVGSMVSLRPKRKLNILDLGSNDGILSMPLMKRFSDNIETLTMYDGSKDVLDFVKSQYEYKYPQIQYINDDVRNVLSYDIKPDVVIIGELLEHVENTKEFLDFLMQLSTGNTMYYFTVPRGPWESIIKHPKEIHHVHHFELEDIKHIFANVDITIDRNKGTVNGRRMEPCDNWMFWFNGDKNSTFNELDYASKFIKTRPHLKVSAALICGNEEDYLSRCLKSIDNFVDEIVVVINADSNDDTQRIAEKFTDKVYRRVWAEEDGLGDFSKARNYSIEKTSGDLVFYIDADEELVEGEKLHTFAISGYYDSILVCQRNVHTVNDLKSSIRNDPYHDRLFKRHLRFTGVIHEYLSYDNEHFIDNALHQEVSYLLHYGFTKHSHMLGKVLNRNAALTYKNYEKFPNRLFSKYHLLTNERAQIIADGDPTHFERSVAMWNELKQCDDPWILSMCCREMINMYSYCYDKGIGVQVQEFEKEDERIKIFYRFEDELELFLKYL